MPKYRDKMQLRRIHAEYGPVDPFTEYLILSGYSYDVALGGLQSFVEDWAMELEYYVKCLKYDPPVFGLCSEEFEFDVWKRTELYQLWQMAPEKMRDEVQETIEALDLIFRQATIQSRHPYQFIEDPDPEEHWWLYRIPLDGLH
jgi:hypothetical protein